MNAIQQIPIHPPTLFTKYPFIKGMARVIDLFGLLDKNNSSGEDAESYALRRDWYMIGQDIAHAIEQYAKGQTTSTTNTITFTAW